MIYTSIMSSNFVLASQAGAEGNGIFSGTLGDSIWAVVWFVILLLVLKRFAWKQILSGLKAREDRIRKDIADAESIKVNAQEKLDEYKEKLAGIKTEASDLAKEHMEKAHKQAKLVMEKTQAESKAAKEKAMAEIELAKLQAKRDLVGELGDVVMNLGSEIFNRTITSQDNQKLIDDAVDKLKDQFDE